MSTIGFAYRDLVTWFDVERRVFECTKRLTKFPAPITRIRIFPHVIELVVSPGGSSPEAVAVFSKWFTPSEFVSDLLNPSIQLRVGAATIPIIVEEEAPALQKAALLPLWEQVIYLPDDGSRYFDPARKIQYDVDLYAFHSFKGGVGRTTSMMAFAAAYTKTKRAPVLLVDADVEAPGISYWLTAAQRGSVSFTGLLEAIHSPATTVEESIAYFANEIKKAAVELEGQEVFLLPAFIDKLDLLSARVAPEHLIRSAATRWQLGDVLAKLAELLGVKAVFVDLRAGLSELSSPILFDARFKRFVVTTLAEQSIAGVELTLDMLRRGHEAWRVAPGDSFGKDPSLIFSMITEEQKKSPLYTGARERLELAYSPSLIPTSSTLDTSLTFFEAGFAPDLMAIRNLDIAYSLVQKTRIFDEATVTFRTTEAPAQNPRPAGTLDSDASALHRTASIRVYAEAQVPKGLLATEALRNLARAFQADVPNAVLIGAKGSGKTFSFLQIAISKTWDKFLNELGFSFEGSGTVSILPFLRSSELHDANLQAVTETYIELQKSFGVVNESSVGLSQISDLIVGEHAKGSTQLPDWVGFWVGQFARSVGAQCATLDELNSYLHERGRKVVFLIDGLEDVLKNVITDSVQRAAIEALIELPNRIRELRSPSLGVLAYVREDFARAVKTQNFGQFQTRYEKFQLNWSPREFLQLIYWLCAEAGVIDASSRKVDSLSTEKLIDALQRLWGKKLGRDDAAEAYTARWVYAAVCDLRGQLQARDVVRFLALASEQAPSKRLSVWLDRVIPPAALRAALPRLSELKIQEAIEEYPALKQWSETLKSIEPEKKRMPFSAEDTGLDSVTRQTLQTVGVIYEDIEKSDAERLYVPEIYRQGLGIGSNIGARPRVQALLQRALGHLPF